MRFEFDLNYGFSGPHSFAWRARATEFEEMRVLARAAIVSGDFTALAVWADRRRPEHDQRRRVACVKFGPEADDLICGLLNSFRPGLVPLTLDGLELPERESRQLVEQVDLMQKYRGNSDSARLFRTQINFAVHAVERLQRAAFSPSLPPRSPAEAARLALATTLDFDAGEFGLGGFWGDLLPGPRAVVVEPTNPVFLLDGADASVDPEWLNFGNPWFIASKQHLPARAALAGTTEHLGALEDLPDRARARAARMSELVVPPPPWAWTYRDPEGHARAFQASWHNDFSTRRTRFFEEFDLAVLAGDTLVFADTSPELEEQPRPPKPGLVTVPPEQVLELRNHLERVAREAITALTIGGPVELTCFEALELPAGPITVSSETWGQLERARERLVRLLDLRAPVIIFQNDLDRTVALLRELPRG